MINAAPFNRFDRNSKRQGGKGETYTQDLNIQRGEFSKSDSGLPEGKSNQRHDLRRENGG